ncbi:MAG: SulP family inorganic anion transporter, partial [Burkholderia sp.]|nr:SulP family inorganic anion transporter [Burkholderia sp.]
MSTARLRLPAVWLRWVPGVAMLRTYQRGWLPRDLLAGVVLTAVLVPIGMSYAQASGLPVIAGLYATIAALVGYAIFGPSRILVLGPDSALAALIAGAIVPLAHGDAGRALALAALLAIMSGALCTLAGVLKLGFVTDLLSRPIQYGYLNGIAVTLAVGQVPGLLGFSASGATFADAASNIVRGVLAGRVDSTSFTLGAGCIDCLMLMRRYAPRWPGVLVAVIATTLAGRWLQHAPGARVAVVGMLPGGAPWPRIPRVPLADIGRLAPGAIAIALVSVADISVLSRAFSASNGDDTDRNQELVALGIANLLAGLLRGCAVSSSSSRTPVALAAGARTQLTNLAAAACIALLLVLPAMLSHVPSAALAAVVIFSAAGIIDVRSMARLFRMRRGEFAISLFCFAGVVLLGVVPGILLA